MVTLVQSQLLGTLGKSITGYTLLNAEARAAANPKTFHIPTLAERRDVFPGELVKIGFELVGGPAGGPNAERMWVIVGRREEKAGVISYAGTLDNDPAVFPKNVLKCGDRIEFSPAHILTIGAPE